jgi:hypothetical protein
MKIRVLKLGEVCTDKATGLTGTLTHWLFDMGQRIDYIFQPQGLNPDNGQPVNKIFIELERLETTENQFEEVEVPFEILGTIVTNMASGFKGMAVNFVRHVNGCFHVAIQPAGRLSKTNSPIQKAEFDLRECSGKMIQKLTDEQLKKSKEKRPSPTGDRFEKHIPGSGSISSE